MSIFQKMMAIAGRNPQGKARAVNTDESGTIKVRPVGNSEELAKNVSVIAETSFISKAMVAQYPNINIFLSINKTGGPWDVDIEYLSDTDVVLFTETNIMSGRTANHAEYNIPLKHLRFRLVFNLRHTSNRILETMTVSSVPTPPTYIPKYGNTKIVELAHIGGVNVDKNNSRDLNVPDWTLVPPFDTPGSGYLDVKDFVYLFVVVRTDADHEFEMRFTWAYFVGHFGNSTGPNSPVVWRPGSGKIRFASEWIEITGNRCKLKVFNNDTENDHIYDIVLFGVR